MLEFKKKLIEFFLDAKDNQQVIRNRTKSLPPQKATLESDYSTDDEEMVSINLENENSRLSRRDQKTAVRNERSTSESRGYKEGVSKLFNDFNYNLFIF